MQGFVMFEWLLRKVRFQSLDGRNRKHHFLVTDAMPKLILIIRRSDELFGFKKVYS